MYSSRKNQVQSDNTLFALATWPHQIMKTLSLHCHSNRLIHKQFQKNAQLASSAQVYRTKLIRKIADDDLSMSCFQLGLMSSVLQKN